MRAYLLLVALVCVAADDALVTPSAPDPRLPQWHKDRELVRALVEEGVRMGRQNGVAARAASCAALLERLASEVQRAVDDNQPERAGELAGHCQSVLRRAVLRNLGEAAPPGADRAELIRNARRALDATRKVEAALEKNAFQAAHWRPAREGLQETRERIERSLDRLEGR